MKVLVKVGKESDLKIRGAELKRAITMNEAKKALDKDSYDKVIFEDIDDKAFSKIEELQADKSTFIIYNKIPVDSVKEKAQQLRIKVYDVAKELEQYIESMAGATGLEIKSANEILDDTSRLEKELGIGEKKEEQEEEDFSKYQNYQEEGEYKNKNESSDSTGKEVDVRQEFIQASASVEYLEAQLRAAEEANANILAIKDMLEVKISNYEKKIAGIMVSSDVAEATWIGANDKEMLAELDKLRQIAEEASDIKIEIEMLRKTVKSYELAEIEHGKEVEKLEERTDYEVEARLVLSKTIKALAWKLYNTKKDLVARSKEIGSLMSSIDKLELRIKEVEKERDDVKKGAEDSEHILTEQIYMLSAQVEDLMHDIEESSVALMLHETTLKEKDDKINELESVIESQQETINFNQLAMNEQSDEINRFKSIDFEDMEENIAALQESNSTLASEIGKYRRDRDELQRQLENSQKQITELKKNNDALGITARSLSRSTDASETIRIKCDYTGKAFVIPVFGSGSYGTSAVSVAISNVLKGRVLVVDFDVINPKLDGWFSLSPIIRELPDMTNDMKKTGFGCLIEKGLSYILDNEKAIVRTVLGQPENSNRVDYISGAYTKIDMYKLMAVNFSEFFTYYGNEYDYIVVDCGRLGGSEMANALIRMLNDISFKNIIVGLGNDTDCRTVALRMRAENIDGAKTIWVLNMMRRKVLGEIMKKSIAYAAEYTTIPFCEDMYGENLRLDEYRDTTGYIDKLVSLILK